MSDGNYNRNLLPYHNYQSGLRAGQAAMRHRAVEAFARFLEKHEPELPAAERERLTALFREELL